MTEEQREQFDANLKVSGYESFQEAFEAWLGASSVTGALSAAEKEYLAKWDRASAIEKRLGQKKVQTLVNLYRAAARELEFDEKFYGRPLREIPEEFERIVARMTKTTGEDVRALVAFKEWVSLWKDLLALERRIREGTSEAAVDGGIRTSPSAAPSPQAAAGEVAEFVL